MTTAGSPWSTAGLADAVIKAWRPGAGARPDRGRILMALLDLLCRVAVTAASRLSGDAAMRGVSARGAQTLRRARACREAVARWRTQLAVAGAGA
jgi:hypothetical protein